MDFQRTGKRLTHTSDLLYLLYNKGGGDKATWKTNYSAKDIFNYKPKIGESVLIPPSLKITH